MDGPNSDFFPFMLQLELEGSTRVPGDSRVLTTLILIGPFISIWMVRRGFPQTGHLASRRWQSKGRYMFVTALQDLPDAINNKLVMVVLPDVAGHSLRSFTLNGQTCQIVNCPISVGAIFFKLTYPTWK